MGLGEKFRKYGGPEIYNKDSSKVQKNISRPYTTDGNLATLLQEKYKIVFTNVHIHVSDTSKKEYLAFWGKVH